MNKFVVTLVSLKLVLATAFLALFLTGDTVAPQAAGTPPEPSPTVDPKDKIDRKTSEPYTGDVSIFEDVNRHKNLQIDRAMDILKISDKSSVADIGAGGGWFTVRAARRVGREGNIFAVEINQAFIDSINDRAKKEGLTNIKTFLGKEDDPLLPAESVNAVLILKTYHEIAEPIRFMKKLKPAIKPGGLVGIIDRNGTGADHGLNKDKVISELKLAGFVLKEEYDFVKPDKMDYFLVFEVAGRSGIIFK